MARCAVPARRAAIDRAASKNSTPPRPSLHQVAGRPERVFDGGAEIGGKGLFIAIAEDGEQDLGHRTAKRRGWYSTTGASACHGPVCRHRAESHVDFP